MGILSHLIVRRVLVCMLFIGPAMLGYISYKQLPVELIPNAEFPLLVIQVASATEVTPEYMEREALLPLEGAVGTLGGIEELRSFSGGQVGIIYISYESGTNVKYAQLKLEQKVNEVKEQLDESFQVQIQSVNTSRLNARLMTLQVLGDGGVDRVRNIAEKDIVQKLKDIDGIADVQLLGGREKTIEVILDKEACEAQNITAQMVRNALSNMSATRSYAGNIEEGNQRMFVNVSGEFSSVNNLGHIVVKQEGPVLLKDVAEVNFGFKKETSYSRVDGKDVVTLNLVRDTQVNLIEVSHRALDKIEELNAELASQGSSIRVLDNQAETMETNISQIISLASFGGLLAIFILWIFLKRIRLVIILALSIPASIFISFNMFYVADISVNSLTLVGMALAVGMLLDNSIVVIENIYRLVGNGMNTKEAVVKGTKEVSRSVIAATLTTITVFLPFVFADNYFIKLIGTNVGVSIVSTLVVSLLVALVLIPMLTYQAIKHSKQKKGTVLFSTLTLRHRVGRLYLVMLKLCLRNPLTTVVGSVVFFLVSILLSLLVSVVAQPDTDQNEVKLYVSMPTGATLELTDEVVGQLEEKIKNIEEKDFVTSQVEPDRAILTVALKDDYEDIAGNDFAEVKQRLEGYARLFNDVDISLDEEAASQGGAFSEGGGNGPSGGAQLQRLLGFGGPQMTIELKGENFSSMKDIGEILRDRLLEMPVVVSCRLNVRQNQPEAHVNFNQELMASYDISLLEVTNALRDFEPESESNVNFKQGNEDYTIIIVQEEEPQPKKMYDLEQLPVTSTQGVEYKLTDFSSVGAGRGPSGINRVNQEKQIELTFAFSAETLDSKALSAAAEEEVRALISSIQFPQGMTAQPYFEDTTLQSFYFLIGMAVIIIFMILASVFESFYLPFVIMFTIPMAATGAFLGLAITGHSIMNTNTFIGALILLGVVVNNGILLIDYSRILRRGGQNRFKAIITAGISRIRPVMITTVTTVVGMLPLAMGEAEYVSVIGATFAITVIGGLMVSTLLTLILVPTAGLGLENALRWFYSLKVWLKVLQIVLIAGLGYIIYTGMSSLLWQSFFLLLTVLLVPAATYFVLHSLRRATTTLVDEGTSVTIKVQNLVKTYGRDGKFMREWKNVSKYRKSHTSTRKGLFEDLLWTSLSSGFFIYFIYFYLGSGFWKFVLLQLLYALLLYTIAPIVETFKEKKWARWLQRLVSLGFPIFNFLFFLGTSSNTGLIIVLGILWFSGYFIYRSAQRIKNGKEPDLTKGRFKAIRRGYNGLIKKIPSIGVGKQPFRALKGVNLTIESGMFGLLGPNGAGKTTLMRIICGILDQSYGKIWINGIDTQEKREELQGLIGYLPQAFGTYENMTPEQFLHYQGILKGLTDQKEREERVQYLLEAVHMTEQRHKPIGSFSGGMKQRIGIAQTLLHLPKILVVDEPTAGLDPIERIRFRNLLVQLSRDRIVIFSTHIIEDIASSCNQVGVLIEGNIRYTGSPAEMAVIAKDKVWEFDIDPEDMEATREQYHIVHHMREGDKIGVRCMAEIAPVPEATSVTANLEDAYLWMLKGK